MIRHTRSPKPMMLKKVPSGSERRNSCSVSATCLMREPAMLQSRHMLAKDKDVTLLVIKQKEAECH